MIPTSASLKQYVAYIEDQGNVGCCVAEATTNAIEILLQRDNKYRPLSVLFTYFCARSNEGIQYGPDGVQRIADALWMANAVGVVDGSAWPFVPGKENVLPPADVFLDAAKLKVTAYQFAGISTPTAMQNWRNQIAAGYPIIIALQVTNQIFGLQPQDMYMGTLSEPAISSHALCVIGYDERGFIVENSWGKDWCDQGCFHLPYETAIQDAKQAWIITGLTGVNIVPIVQHKSGTGVYLGPNASFTVSDECSVYGSATMDNVVNLTDTCQDVVIDSNVHTVNTPASLFLQKRQAGNGLELYGNGVHLATWTISTGHVLNGLTVTLMNGIMTVGGVAVSTVSPQ